jgi:hypothetical protein
MSSNGMPARPYNSGRPEDMAGISPVARSYAWEQKHPGLRIRGPEIPLQRDPDTPVAGGREGWDVIDENGESAYGPWDTREEMLGALEARDRG